MMKLGNLLKSRGIISGHYLRSNVSKDVVGLHTAMGCAGFATFGQNGFSDDRVFAAYNIYKGKAVLSAEPVAPTFVKRDSGCLSVKRSGYIMLCISPAIGERKYDWKRKQKFALSATEVGSLVALGPTGSCEFFHDPGMQTSKAGQIRKSLLIKANPEGNGYFISLNVVDSVNKVNERFSLPVTAAEFAVMRTSFSFALPLIMGWDRYSKGSPAAVKHEYSAKMGQQSFNSVKPKNFGSEWER